MGIIRGDIRSVNERAGLAKYLITGGSGFIGTHLTSLLLKKGHSVRILDRVAPHLRSPQLEFVEGDLTDPNVIKKSLPGVEGCFHLAAMISVEQSIQEWSKGHQINQTATIQLLEAIRLSPIPILFASSAAVYGQPGDHAVSEKSLPCPLSPYGVDKYASEMQMRLAHGLYGIPSLSVRFFNVYGPGQNPSSPYAGVISLFASKLLSNEPLTVFGDGQQRRDFIFVRDIANLLYTAMQHPEKNGDVYNGCSGKVHSLLDLIAVLESITGIKAKVQFALAREGEIRFSQGDPSKTAEALGFTASTSLKQGLEETLEYCKQGAPPCV